MPQLTDHENPVHVLESRAYLRAVARQATSVRCEAGTVFLSTEAAVEQIRALSSADPELLSLAQAAADGKTWPGTWRCDLLGADRLRVRYNLGDRITAPDGPSPMLLQAPPPAPALRWIVGETTVTAHTGRVVVTVSLEDLRITVADRATGATLCAWGGAESNRFRPWASSATGVSRSLATGRPLAHEAFVLHQDEAIWGFGETFGSVNHRGRTLNLDLTDALGVNTQRYYKPVPFWISSRGYGAFFHHAARTTAWIGSLSATDLQIGVDDDHLDFFLFLGTPEEILQNYTALTGRPECPPSWSFGLIQGKCSYQSAAEVDAVVSRYREDKIPLGIMHLDTHWFTTNWLCDLTFDPTRFPQPAAWMASLAAQGVRICLWQLPYLPEGSPLFEEIAAAGGFVKNREGTLYDIGICYVKNFGGRVGVIDYTHPEACRIHRRWLEACLRLGAAFFKTDFGEDAPVDGVYHDGTPGHRMHNLYPLLYNQVVAEATQAVHGHRLVWARSAWAGGQRYGVHWGGDASATWADLAATLSGGLSLGMSGFSFWAHDVGGFLGKSEPRLFIRWLQVALLGSHLRLHAAGRPCELYAWGDEAYAIARRLLRLREELRPYLEATARESATVGLPCLRSLALAFPTDRNVWTIADQFLVGKELLVAPILTPEDQRSVYFPAGTWRCHWTAQRVEGPCRETFDVPLERLPFWHRHHS